MIKLENINIMYDRNIIENGQIEAYPGEILCITGESGSGKTTLLYMLGLISSITNYKYYFNNVNIDITNDKQKSILRKEMIGYIFQDNNLIDDLSVLENIRLSATISNNIISDKQIERIIERVRLDNIKYKDVYPNTLSGGEKQRLAIACALAKNPMILLADEPTSSLDEKNTELIIRILREIAADGKYVIIASHDNKIVNIADRIYSINDRTINTQKSCEPRIMEIPLKKISAKHLPLRFFNRYSKKTSKKNRLQNAFLISFCSLAIALLAIANSFGNQFVAEQKDKLNLIANNQLFVVNATFPAHQIIDLEENVSMSNDDISKIQENTSVSNVYPFYYFPSFGYTGNDFENIGAVKISDGKAEKDFLFDSESNNTNFNKYSVMPCFFDEIRDEMLSYGDINEGNGVYLSNSLFQKLGINYNKDIQIKFDAYVPIKLFDSNAEIYGTQYDVDLNVYKKVNLVAKVYGVFNDNVINNYTNFGDDIIYINYEEMANIIALNKDTNLKVDSDFPEKVLSPSALIVKTKSFEVISNVKDAINELNSNFRINSPYQNTQAMVESLKSLKTGTEIFSSIIIVILFSLMSVIFINRIDKRKYEFSILKANGLTKNEAQKIVIADGISLIAKIITISTSLFLIFNFLLASLLVFDQTKYGYLVAIITISLASLASVLFPSFASMSRINKYNPDLILRN